VQKQPVRLAFVGGKGHRYLRHLLLEPEAESRFTVAFAGDGYDNAAAEKTARDIKGALWFDSPETLFEEFQPDIINLGAVYGYNGDIAAQALERDIKVVSDKPVAATWKQFERLRELTQDPSRVLLTEFPFRCLPPFRAARAAVQQGKIGEVALVTAQKSYRFGASRPAWYANRDDYAGTMLWVASHGIDAMSFCAMQPFTRVVGMQGNLTHPDYGTMEDYCVAMFELGNGGSAIAHADYLRPSGAASHGDDRLRIAGGRGLLEVRDGRCMLMTGDEPEVDITDSIEVRPIHEEMWAALHGESNDIYSTTNSLELAEILLKARDAADQKQWQSILGASTDK
jgi:predicted dehydrogenase